MKILKNKDKVMKLLKEFPHLRDNDFKLMANIWWSELGEEKKEMQVDTFLYLFSKGRLSHPETIRRIRAKLQEEFPELRGESYHIRHNIKEDVRKDLMETPELYRGGTP